MIAGVSFKGDKGQLQINSSYYNLAFKEKKRINLEKYATASFSMDESTIIAYRNDSVSIVNVETRDGNTYLKITDGGSDRGSRTVDLFFFDKPEKCGKFTEESCGLQVFKEDGSLAFDSRIRYMHVLSYVNATTSEIEHSKNNLVYDAGARTPAIVQNVAPVDSSTDPLYSTAGYVTEGNRVLYASTINTTGPVPESGSVNWPYRKNGFNPIFFIDVTGL